MQPKHENALLHSGRIPPLDQDRELKVAYCRLNEVEQGWNYTRRQLDAAHEKVDTRTHAIIHLEYAME
jgi:hypothetical protein